MPGVIHFEIPADDMERAISFYKDVFDWKVDVWSESYRPVFTNGRAEDPGINGALVERSQAVQSACNTIDVASVDDFVEKIEMHGGNAFNRNSTYPRSGIWRIAKTPRETASGSCSTSSLPINCAWPHLVTSGRS